MRRARLQLDGPAAAALHGGVAANGALRAALKQAGDEDGFTMFVPPPRHCTDNAAMIAAAGTARLGMGERADLALNAQATLPLA